MESPTNKYLRMNTEQLEQLEKKLKELQDNITAISGYLVELKYDIKNKK